MITTDLIKIVQSLPPELQHDIEEYIQEIIHDHKEPQNRKLKQDWAGGLSKYKDKYSSVELQKRGLLLHQIYIR